MCESAQVWENLHEFVNHMSVLFKCATMKKSGACSFENDCVMAILVMFGLVGGVVW